jgi:hypothetical protein
MRSTLEFCTDCQIDLQIALLNAEDFEHNCSGKQCPFARQLRAQKMHQTTPIFEARVTPEIPLEGSDISISWSYKGNIHELEYISLNLLHRNVTPSGRVTLKADRKKNRFEFTIKLRGLQPVRKVYTYKLHLLPEVRLKNLPERVPRDSSVSIVAELKNVSSAIIVDQLGYKHDFTSGKIKIPALIQDSHFKIVAIGRFGGKIELPVMIRVFDPPQIRFLKPVRETMTFGKVGMTFQALHAATGRLELRDKKGVLKVLNLTSDDCEKGICSLDVESGSWSSVLTILNKYGDEIRAYSDFRVVDTPLVKARNILVDVILGALLMALLGGAVYMIWPIIEIIYQVLYEIFFFAYSVIKIFFGLLLIALFIWLLYEIIKIILLYPWLLLIPLFILNPWFLLIALFIWFLYEIS